MADTYITREMRRELERENAKWPTHFVDIPRDQWPTDHAFINRERVRVLRSRDFLVQVFSIPPLSIPFYPFARITINRTQFGKTRWEENITWDELQSIKRQVGFGNYDALEVFPADEDVVNVANMRHLWIMKDHLSFAWRK